MNTDAQTIIMPHKDAVWLPTNPPRLCPDILTAEEAIIYLRLDKSKVNDPNRTLRRYRDEGRLIGCRIGRDIVYRLADLKKFVNEQEAVK